VPCWPPGPGRDNCGLIDGKTTVLAVIYPDARNHVNNDVVIFARVKDGKYLPVDDYDDAGKKTGDRACILRAVKTYYTPDGPETIKVKIDGIVTSRYNSRDVTAGRFGIGYLLEKTALASNPGLPSAELYEGISSKSGDSTFFRVARIPLLDSLRNRFGVAGFQLVRFLDTKDILCIANAKDSAVAVSNLCFLSVAGRSVSVKEALPGEFPVKGKWGWGYKFLDYRDADNDGISELFLLFNGSDSTAVDIFRRSGSKYLKIFGHRLS